MFCCCTSMEATGNSSCFYCSKLCERTDDAHRTTCRTAAVRGYNCTSFRRCFKFSADWSVLCRPSAIRSSGRNQVCLHQYCLILEFALPGAGSENLTGAKAPAAQRWCHAIGSRGGEWFQSAVGCWGFPLLCLPHPFPGLSVRACVREGGSDLERGRHSVQIRNACAWHPVSNFAMLR